MKPREIHVHIGRLVVDGAAGTDRHAIARSLGQQLPGALATRIEGAGIAAAPRELHDRIADAVATQVRTRLP